MSEPRERRRLEWLVFATPCAVVWTIYLLAFWPGVMNPDAIGQWGQMLSGRLNDWHPAFHTLTNWLITRLWLSPAAVALVQIVAASALIGWGLALMLEAGVSRGAAWLACAVIAALPANGYLVIAVSKDIPYTLSLLALTLLFLRTTLTRGYSLQRPGAWLWLGVTAALVVLYRHNGGPALLALPGLALAYCRSWRRVAAALVLALVLVAGIRGPLYRALGIHGPAIWLALPFIHQVAAHVRAGTVPPEQIEYLGRIRRLDDGWGYRWATIDPTLFSPGARFDWQVIIENPRRFLDAWWAMTRRNPGVTLRHLRRSSSLVWRVRQKGPGFRPYYLKVGDGVVTTIAANDLGLERRSKLPSVMELLLVGLARSQDASWLLLRPALPLYLGLAGLAALALRRREWPVLLTALPVVLHSLALMSTTLGQELRFQYPAYLTGWLLAALLLAKPRGLAAEAAVLSSSVHEAQEPDRFDGLSPW